MSDDATGPDQRPEQQPGTPAEEVGYWEQRAAEERAREQRRDQAPTGPGIRVDPQGGHPRPPPPYDEQSYGPSPYRQPPYGPATYGQPPSAPGPQPGIPTPPANPYGNHLITPPSHDRAGLALGLGVASIVGGLLCFGIPLLAAPFAWAVGHRSLREIRASNGQVSGEGMAMAGMVTGIIGTVLLAIVVVLIVGFAIVVAADVHNTA